MRRLTCTPLPGRSTRSEAADADRRIDMTVIVRWGILEIYASLQVGDVRLSLIARRYITLPAPTCVRSAQPLDPNCC